MSSCPFASTESSRTLLPMPGNEIHLQRYGYSIDANNAARKRALLEASKKHGMLKVYRRLVLLSNYQKSNKHAYDIMVGDKEFLKVEYKKSKKKSRKGSKKGSRKGSRKMSRKGSRKGSKKGSRKGSRKMSRKGSRKGSRK